MPSSELIRACRKSYGKTIRQTARRRSRRSRRPEQSLRPGHGRQPLLDELAAAGQARAAQEEREHDDEEDEQLGSPASARRPMSVGNQLCVCPVDEERLDRADREPGEARNEEGGEAGEEGRGERGHDLEGQRLRVERDERRDEDAEPSGDDAREHGVHRSPGGSARARRASPRPRSPTPPASTVRRASSGTAPPAPPRRRSRSPASRKRSFGTTRSKNVTVPEGRMEGADFRCCRRSRSHPPRRTSSRPSDAASFASGAVFRSGRKIGKLDQDAEDSHAGKRQDEGRRGREVKTEVAGPERPEDVRGQHRDRPGGDVHHTRSAVDEHDAERDAGDERAGAESQRCVEEDVPHREVGGPGKPGPTNCSVFFPTSPQAASARSRRASTCPCPCTCKSWSRCRTQRAPPWRSVRTRCAAARGRLVPGRL